MTWGTSYFVSRKDAVRYYRAYEGSNAEAAVARKLKEGEIHIGAPHLKAGERLLRIDGGTRFAIQEAKGNPRRKPVVTADSARRTLQGLNIAAGEDFHVLSSSQVDGILEEANKVGYRKPKNASGSRARYFHAFLQRKAGRSNPPSGWIPATAVKITRKAGRMVVRIRRAVRRKTAKRRR